MKRLLVFPAALAVASASPAFAGEKKEKTVELSATELAAIQTKSYDTTFATAFPATISTIQSLGYLNINASKDAGTITAETEAKGKVIYNIIWGFGKKKRTQLSSIFIEETNPGKTVIKLNLLISESKSRGFSNSFKDGQIIKTAEPYKQFFDALDAEIARRTTPQ